MRKLHWKAVAVVAALMMTVPALLALAADKSDETGPAGQAMPGCAMHAGAEKGADAAMPGCTMKGAAVKGGCSQSCDMKGCGTKCGKGKECCKSGDMKGCGMKGGKGKECCKSGDMKGGKGKECCKSGDMMGCDMKGGKHVAVCVVSDGEMKGCAKMSGKGMAGCASQGGGMERREVKVMVTGGGMEDGPMGGPMGAGMGPGHGPMMLKALELTADQQKKVEAIHAKQARLMVQAQADIRIATMDLQQLMRAENPDRPKIDAQIDKVAQMRAGMQKSRAATMLEVRALLTPEQLKKFQAGPMGGEEAED